MKTEIVIARYNEDLSWLKKLPKTIKITVYNKGLDNLDIPSIRLPNIGRESHTYLYHIIQNYDNLAEQTIFCQGDSIFHSPDFLELIKNRKYFEPIQPLSAFYWPEKDENNEISFSDPPLPLLEKTKNLHIKGSRIHVEYMDNDFVTQYPYHYEADTYAKFVSNVKKIYNVSNVLEFNITRFRLKNVDLNKLIPVCFAALFAVNRDVIRENSLDFYNNIMSIILYDHRIGLFNKQIDHGQFLEKLWLLIFNYRKNNKNYIDINVVDYLTSDKNIPIHNNNISFTIFIIYCQLYSHIIIDNIKYELYISRYRIYLKSNGQTLFKSNVGRDKMIQGLLKDMSNVSFQITLKNNVLNIIANNKILISHNFKHNVKNMSNIILYSLSKDNLITFL